MSKAQLELRSRSHGWWDGALRWVLLLGVLALALSPPFPCSHTCTLLLSPKRNKLKH